MHSEQLHRFTFRMCIGLLNVEYPCCVTIQFYSAFSVVSVSVCVILLRERTWNPSFSCVWNRIWHAKWVTGYLVNRYSAHPFVFMSFSFVHMFKVNVWFLVRKRWKIPNVLETSRPIHLHHFAKPLTFDVVVQHTMHI